jgi:hypothetical protein
MSSFVKSWLSLTRFLFTGSPVLAFDWLEHVGHSEDIEISDWVLNFKEGCFLMVAWGFFLAATFVAALAAAFAFY